MGDVFVGRVGEAAAARRAGVMDAVAIQRERARAAAQRELVGFLAVRIQKGLHVPSLVYGPDLVSPRGRRPQERRGSGSEGKTRL